MRSLYFHDSAYREGALNRWDEIIQEGPDMIMVGDVNKFNYNTIPYRQMLQAAAKSPVFDGQIIFSPQKERLLTAGIGSSYLCATSEQQFSGKALTSILDEIDTRLQGALQECGNSCSSLASRLHLSDETTMSWSFDLYPARYLLNTFTGIPKAASQDANVGQNTTIDGISLGQ